ncbi:MAG: stage III sporulation protein AA [Bariatricus sp.]|nr:stage III sporulation protein AA [Bariatricus sp.]
MRRERKNQIFRVLAERIRGIILNEGIEFSLLQEIRLREAKPLAIYHNGEEKLFNHIVTREELRETMEYIANYSLYAYEEEMKQGFLTIDGGHRVGISGKIIPDGGHVRNFQYISSINIRICHEIKGCADRVFPAVLDHEKLCHTLIISPPGRGKTTLLRDMVRQISDGNAYIKGKNVGVVDERSEIGGCYQGVPQNQVGKRTDILDNCPKAEGMMMMIRSMSPQVLAVDEIGTEKDVEAVAYAMRCGVVLMATVHGTSLEEIREKPLMKRFWEGHDFKRYIVMKENGKTGEIEGIYDDRGERVCC